MFRCEYCGQTYVREHAFLNHKCDQMKRAATLDTQLGRTAYKLYQRWWTMRKRQPPNVDTFRDSTQFNHFVDFARFVKSTKLNVDVYMQLVVRHQLGPEHWTRDDVYSKYLEYIDKSMPSTELIKMSVDYVLKLADVIECDTGDVFEFLEVTDVLQLIRDRKLTPWILLHSKKFKIWLIKQHSDDQHRLQELIRPVYWKLRFEREPEMVQHAKRVTKALGL